MSYFHEQYKKKSAGFTSTAAGRRIRAGEQNQQRRANRAETFLKYRDIPESRRQQGTASCSSSDPVVRLEKWRLDRALKRKIEQRMKKPVFKVGIVHHKFYSPIVNHQGKAKPVLKVKENQTPPKRITRATQKRLAEKQMQTASLAAPATSKCPLGSTHTRTKKCLLSKKDTYRSFAPENYPFTVPTAVKGLPLFGRFISTETPSTSPSVTEPNEHDVGKSLSPTHTVQSHRNSTAMSNQRTHHTFFCQDTADIEKYNEIAQTSLSENHFENANTNKTPASAIIESDTPPAPATFSPYITMSRGKRGARKEHRSKMGISSTPPDGIPTKHTVMKNLNVSIEEEERTAQYFKFILQREIDKLTELCVKWDLIKNEPDLPEDAQLRINQAIGQTNLLITKKFERFKGLVLDCETGKGEMLVQCKDLQGFWDMMYMEVKDCELRFSKLDMLRSKNWIEDNGIDLVRTTKQETRKKPPVERKPKIATKSSARSWILERKKMLRNENSSGNVVIDMNSYQKQNPLTSRTTTPLKEQTYRRSMKKSPQDSVTSRVTRISPTKKTPPVKKVQLSKATNNIHSPLAVIKRSKMGKTPEIRYDDTISYINSDQTPGKGILKKSEDSSSLDSSLHNSTKKVDFNEEVALNEAPTDEDLQNSIDLGRALASIDGYDSEGSDNVVYEPNIVSDNLNDVFDAVNDDLRNITIRRVDKRLDFEDESFNETENPNTTEMGAVPPIPAALSIPIINFTLSTPARSGDSPRSSPQISSKRSRRTSKAFAESNEDTSVETLLPSSLEPKVLRNRIVTPLSSTSHRKIRKSLQNDTSVLSLNLSAKENNDPQRGRKKISGMETSQIADTERENQDERKKRRSSRKSVRFNAAANRFDCVNSGKFAQPPTPHSYKNKKISLLGDSGRYSAIPFSSGDLISFDSPA